MILGFLDGRLLEVTGLPAVPIPESASVDVFLFNDVEIEVNCSGDVGRREYLENTYSRLEDSFTLPDHSVLEVGGLGGDPTSGWVFAIAARPHRHLYGTLPPSMSGEEMASFAASMAVTHVEDRLRVDPLDELTRSHFRTPTVLQLVPGYFLLSVKPNGRPSATPGLYRSDSDAKSPYLWLDAGSLSAHILPYPGEDIESILPSAMNLGLREIEVTA